MISVRPVFQPQGPASRCVIQSKQLGWLNCGPVAFAMAIDKATRGKVRLSGCQVRDEITPRDLIGGTNLSQNAAVAAAHGVKVETHTGSGVVAPAYAAYQCQAGRGFVLQGNTRPLIGGHWQSTGGPVNHAVYVNETRLGTLGKPAEYLVYDPAADGRRGNIDQGPSWWPRSLVEAFAAALRPWGDDDPRVLGPGKFYCSIFPDTEPDLWGDDVPADIRAVDVFGTTVAQAVSLAGQNYMTVVNMGDLKGAMRRIGYDFGFVVNPADVRALMRKMGVL